MLLFECLGLIAECDEDENKKFESQNLENRDQPIFFFFFFFLFFTKLAYTLFVGSDKELETDKGPMSYY